MFVHIEAPDEAGHNGSKMEKVQSIEQIDDKIVRPILEKAKEIGDIRILVSPDHPTPISMRTHTRNEVPFIIWGKGIEADGCKFYSERACKKGKYGVLKGHNLIKDVLLNGV